MDWEKRKKSMCGKKVAFRSQEKAAEVAKQHNQKVYGCPICFCYHLTSKADWKDEFVTPAQVATQINAVRTEYNKKMRQKNAEIFAMQKEIKELKRTQCTCQKT